MHARWYSQARSACAQGADSRRCRTPRTGVTGPDRNGKTGKAARDMRQPSGAGVLVRALVEPRGRQQSAQRTEPVARRLGLSPGDFEERLERRGSRLVSRCGWALTYLKKAGLVTFPRRGQVKITEEGLNFLKTHPTFDKGDLETILSFSLFAHGSPGTALVPTHAREGATIKSLPPDEQIALSLAQIRVGLVDDLLASLQSCSPTFLKNLL